jgi:hypothetical protein
MKTLLKILSLVLAGAALHAAHAAPADRASSAAVHRYIVERSFPPGALKDLDAAAKAKVNATNAKFGVNWVMSYANADRTKTYCVYEGPSEAAIREAAKANGMSADVVMAAPDTLLPK